MSIVRAVHEWDDHWPDYGTLVLREAYRQPEDLVPPAGLLPPDELGDPEDMVNGALALTGVGWFHGNTRSDGRAAVRVEVWDGAPPEDDDTGWADADLVADLSYWSPAGGVVLNYLVPMDGGPEFALPGPGPYRIRTWCRALAGEPAEGWRLQFWPLGDAVPGPARWRRRDRTRPTVRELGWSRYFGELARDIRAAVLWAPYRLLETTRADLARRLRAEPDAVAAALAYLAEADRIAVHGDPDRRLVLAVELPETDGGDPYQRVLRDNLLRAAGRPIPADPVDPAPHLRPHRHRPPHPQPTPRAAPRPH